ncbi:chromosome segregation protein SMC [Hahella sp. CCB-MM4]|uniref:chromosome segregation protein SMC n=1 Tax=Hahella sp. (strain CCB-MM4) TaxID=1926491 RepID=UPI000B9A5A83|nr:chromosome segregation protein SMC [Hahella sp. CCB-MM4]OZG71239.1 chromosome segregation protein SMC [Hahella sp. CCB-MM4]
MRLKSIKLAGFKSFVDPTTVHFPSNMSAVVGPNGCGKSNIIDAVRWVMGESSAKHLRGESMADVIFNGSNSRKPVGQASIELIFDNTGGTIQGEFARYNEVSVKRRVTRDGQSVYFLNNNKCRKKDITDIFLGTGLGPRSYAIIEQGMISRLIESKPEDLRIFIEEAAGISKYKERRKETESRMKRTRENLDRLTDIREELDRQLQHLHRQAKAAERYKELKSEERQKKALLNSFKWNQLDRESSELAVSIRDREVELERLLYERTNVDSQLETLRQERHEAGEAVNQAQADYYGTGAEIAKIEQQIKSAREREEQLKAELDQLQQTLSELREERSLEESQQAEVEEELLELEPELEELLMRSETSADQLAEAEETMQRWQHSWDEFSHRNNDLQKTAEIEQSRIQQAEKQVQQLQDRRNKLLDEQRATQSLGDSESLEMLREQLLELELQIEDQNQVHDSHRQSEKELRARLDELSDQLNEIHTREQTLKGEQSSLLALQANDEASVNESAANWLQQAGFDQAPILSDSLKADSQWEAAVETLLHERIQARVLSPEQLKNVRQPPAPGVCLVADHVSPSNVFSQFSGAAEGQCQSSVAQWLDGARSCDSFENAISRLNELGEKEYFVLPDGSRVARFWMQGPHAEHSTAGVLTRTRRLVEIEEQLAEISDRTAEVSEAKSAIQLKLEDFESTAEEHQKTLVDLNKQQLQIKAEISAKEARQEQIERRQAHIASEVAQIDEQLAEENENLRLSREVWQQSLMELEECVEQKESLLNQRDSARQRLDHLRSQARQDREQSHQLQLRVSALSTRRDSVRQALEKGLVNIKRSEDRQQWVEENLNTHQAPEEDLQERLEELLGLRLDQEQVLARQRDRLSDLEKSMQDDEVRRHRNEQSIQTLRGQIESMRMQQREADIRKNTLRDQLAEEELDIQQLLPMLAEEDTEQALQDEIEQIANKINRLGAINLAAIDEYQAQSERKVYLDGQYEDLQEALDTLETAIRKIDKETRNKFKETFDQVNEGLQTLFPRVFGGGHAYLELTGEDLLETGVAIMARPPGKKNSTIHLLSGGEKALTAIALIFSIFQLNPAPFCMLDEVDAPLDDANVGRYARMVKEMSDQVQFIYITHNKIAMEKADHLMGVTMHEPGVSRLVSVDVEEAAALAEL